MRKKIIIITNIYFLKKYTRNLYISISESSFYSHPQHPLISKCLQKKYQNIITIATAHIPKYRIFSSFLLNFNFPSKVLTHYTRWRRQKKDTRFLSKKKISFLFETNFDTIICIPLTHQHKHKMEYRRKKQRNREENILSWQKSTKKKTKTKKMINMKIIRCCATAYRFICELILIFIFHILRCFAWWIVLVGWLSCFEFYKRARISFFIIFFLLLLLRFTLNFIFASFFSFLLFFKLLISFWVAYYVVKTLVSGYSMLSLCENLHIFCLIFFLVSFFSLSQINHKICRAHIHKLEERGVAICGWRVVAHIICFIHPSIEKFISFTQRVGNSWNQFFFLLLFFGYFSVSEF